MKEQYDDSNDKRQENSNELVQGKINFNVNRRKAYRTGKFIFFIMAFVVTCILGNISSIFVARRILNNEFNYIQKVNFITSFFPNGNKNSKVKEIVDKYKSNVVSVYQIDKDDESEMQKRLGTGLIYNKEGYVVIVGEVQKKNNIAVKSYDERIYSCEYVGKDEALGITILKIPQIQVENIIIGDNEDISEKEDVVFIGNPEGFAYKGEGKSGKIINANAKVGLKNKDSGSRYDYDAIKTSIPVIDADNGGCLFDMMGQLIGIVNINYEEENTEGNVSYYIPIKNIKSVVTKMINGRNIVMDRLGIRGHHLKPNSDVIYGGFYVNGVNKDTAFYEAGLRPTDIIISINNEKVASETDICNVLSKIKVDSMVKCVLYRNGKFATIEVQINVAITQDSFIHRKRQSIFKDME